MDDDEDNQQKNEEEEDGPSMKKYNKKSHFNKLTKDAKLLTFKASYKPRNQILKAFRLSTETGKSNFRDRFGYVTKWKLDHKQVFIGIKSNTKIGLNLTNYRDVQGLDINSKLSKKVGTSTLTLTNKYNQKNEFNSKLSHSLNLLDYFKFKYNVEFDNKELTFGGSTNFQFNRNKNGLRYLSFVKQYTEIFGIGLNAKSNNKKKIESYYKSHLITNSNNKLYFQHKGIFDPYNTKSPFTNTFILNAQQSQAIATFNGTINMEGKTIKSHEARLVIEYDKLYRFGIQKKSDNYQFMFERNKIKLNLLKSFKFYVGNTGCLTVIDGRLNILRNFIDYSLNLKYMPKGNFYKDFAIRTYLKWNI